MEYISFTLANALRVDIKDIPNDNQEPNSLFRFCSNKTNHIIYSTSIEVRTQVYRFWSAQNHGHFYISSESEKNEVVDKYTDSEWLLEGIVYYVPK